MEATPEQIEAFAALFRGRDDIWGAVWGQCMKEVVTLEKYAAHLAGETSLGIYPLMKDNNSCFGAFDTDTEDFSIPLRIRNRLDELGVPAHIMRSKSGRYHVYVFFFQPMQAASFRELSFRLLAELGISCEVFPKQDRLEAGVFGNYINLPFFGDERPALDIDCQSITLADFLDSVKFIPVEAIDRATIQLPTIAKPTIETGATFKWQLSCFPKMMQGGFKEHDGRDEICFRCGVHRFRSGEPSDSALAAMLVWDTTNIQPLGENIVRKKIEQAYTGRYRLGCLGPYIKVFCEQGCPIYQKRAQQLDEVERQKLSLAYFIETGGIVFTHFDYEYHCFRHKTGRVEVKFLYNGNLIHTDNLSIMTAKRRREFAKVIAGKLIIEPEPIEADLLGIIPMLSRRPERQVEEKPVSGITEDRINRALKLLQQANLLHLLLIGLNRIGIIGEERNKLMCYLAYTSRITDMPISIVFKGESATGKSWVSGRTLRLFPPECYRELTEATPQSFYYLPEEGLSHQIVVIYEKPGTEKANYAIRSAQSESDLIIQFPTKNPQTGELETKQRRVKGPIMFLFTTIESMMSLENETRLFSLFTDSSRQQTKRILEQIAYTYQGSDIELAEDERLVFCDIQRLLKNYPVLIPYASSLSKKFPDEPFRVRRDFKRFLAVIETITLLMQYQRPKKLSGGKEHLLSTISDYAYAREIAETIVAESIYQVGPDSRKLLKYCEDNRYTEDGDSTLFTYRALAHALKLPKSTVVRWVEPLLQYDFLVDIEEPKRGKERLFKFGWMSIGERLELATIEELIEDYPELNDLEHYKPLLGESPELEI